jgi:hypothetical protein
VEAGTARLLAAPPRPKPALDLYRLFGMSAVSMMSLMPIGIPSMDDKAWPARQRSVERSAAAQAAPTS